MGIVTMLELLLGRVTASGLQLCHVAKVSWHDRVREVPAHVLLQAFEVPFEVWEEAASRHVSLQAQTQPLKAWETSLCFEVSRSPQFSAPHRCAGSGRQLARAAAARVERLPSEAAAVLLRFSPLPRRWRLAADSRALLGTQRLQVVASPHRCALGGGHPHAGREQSNSGSSFLHAESASDGKPPTLE